MELSVVPANFYEGDGVLEGSNRTLSRYFDCLPLAKPRTSLIDFVAAHNLHNKLAEDR